MFTFVSVPTDLVATIATNAGGIFTDLMPVAVIVIGVSLGLVLLTWAVGLFRRRGTKAGY
jgi:hypothetical protein